MGSPDGQKLAIEASWERQNIGHNLGTAAQQPQARSGDQNGAAVHITIAPVSPRLLDLHTAASYLGISEWTVRTF